MADLKQLKALYVVYNGDFGTFGPVRLQNFRFVYPGDLNEDRKGRVIHMRRVSVRGFLRTGGVPSSVPSPCFRIILFRYNQAFDAAQASDILDLSIISAGHTSINSQYNFVNSRNYTILFDKLYNIPSLVWNIPSANYSWADLPFHWDADLDDEVDFRKTGPTSYEGNRQYGIILISSVQSVAYQYYLTSAQFFIDG